jgi:DNA-binding transcriptional ArsR family regulator
MYSEINYNLANLRVPQVKINACPDLEQRSAKPNKQKSHYLRGPLPLAWWGRACLLHGPKILPVALSIWFLAGLRGRKTNLELTGTTLERFAAEGRSSKSRALKTLEMAGLIRVERRQGKNPIVEILENEQSPSGPVWVTGEFICGPVPLSWLNRASRLRGQKVLAVSLAIWFLVGLKCQKKNLKLTRAILKRFGVSDRSTKSRTLDLLEGAGLISVVKQQGKNPRVTLIGAGQLDHKTQPSPPE